MKKLNSSLTNMVVVLTSVAVITGALLAWVNHVTAASIKIQAAKTLSDGIKEVMGVDNLTVSSTDTITKNIDGKDATFVVYSTCSQKDRKPLGVAVESATMGFGGTLNVLVGFAADGTLLGYKILQSSETPGLGQKADKWFQADGKGCIVGHKMDASKPLSVSKDGGDIDAITASTITSRAFLKAVNQAFEATQSIKPASTSTDADSGASPQHATDAHTEATHQAK